MKNFTLKLFIAACSFLYFGNASGQVREWNMSSAEFKALGSMIETKTVNGLTIYAAADKAVVVDSSGSKELDGMVLTYRLKLGGSGTFNTELKALSRVIAFDVTGNTTITVMCMSSSSTTDRKLNLSAGTSTPVLTEMPAPGPALTKTVYTYTGGATTIYLYSPNSGVNIYYIKTAPAFPVAVNDLSSDKSNVAVYPNPASDRVYIAYRQPVKVGIYNITGSLIKSKMISNGDNFLDIEDIQPGAYFVKSQDSNAFTKKLIIK